VNKKERIKRFNSMSSMQRKELILKKMKERGIEVGVEFRIKNTIAKRFMN